MSRRQATRAFADPTNPRPWAVCDRCGDWRFHDELVFQFEWSGTHLYNKRLLVCYDKCYDTPQEQLRTIILPPDPLPVLNARPPNFAVEE